MSRKAIPALLQLLASIMIIYSASCSVTSSPNSGMAMIAVQYATAKAIEQSDQITPEGVIRYAELARTLADDDVMLDPTAIAYHILQALDSEQLSDADKLLARLLVVQIQVQLQELDLLDPATKITLLQVIGWIEQGARLSLAGQPQ